MAPPAGADDTSLKRLGGGRWQTRDERFTIEPESGTWVVVDAQQTDDLGLPLVRGPFRSLGDAKDAIAEARSAPPAPSPLADRIERRRGDEDQPPIEPPGRGRRSSGTAASGSDAAEIRMSRRSRSSGAQPNARDETSGNARTSPTERVEPVEPRWFAALESEERRHARRLIHRLEAAGAPDPEGMARRDIVGEVPAVASWAIEKRLDELGPDAHPAAVAALLAEGRDDDLGVRWRTVDGDGRPIAIRAPGHRAARGR
jgi:hypothetical protein